MNGKVALITGAASGIGQALAVKYAKAGVAVVGGYYEKDPHDPAETQALVREVGGDCVMLSLDVGSTQSVDAAVEHAITRFGRLDYAVANAGILRSVPFETMTDGEWDQIINVDLTGVMRTFRAACRVMAEGGAMVAVSSFYGPSFGWAEHAHYCAAKAGMVGLVKALALELAPRNIRCNTVIPGVVRTPQSLDKVNSIGEAGLDAVGQGLPLKRVGVPDDLADAIHFVTSDAARYMTGQTLVIDGGLTTQWAG